MNSNLKALLVNQYKMLGVLLKNINKNTFIIKPGNGKLSVLENIAHLGRYNEVFLERMQEIQHKNSPAFERYVADNEAGFIEWSSKPSNLAFADFYSSRETINNFLNLFLMNN